METHTASGLDEHRTPEDFSDRIALAITKFLRFFADTFFAKRYGNRAIVLETVAAVPGMVGYFEEEAVVSYTRHLAEIDAGRVENVPAPEIARRYWKMPDSATLRDVVLAVRDDEAGHRDVNHRLADG